MSLTVNDVLRVTARLKSPLSRSRYENVYWYKCTVVVSQVFADIRSDFANQLSTMYDTIAAFQSTNTTSDGFKLVDVTQKETYGKPTWNYAGTDATFDTLPAQICAEVLGYTFESGRFGRKYLGPFLEENILDGAWSAGQITALENFAQLYTAQFVGTVTGNTYIAGVARKEAGVWVLKQFASALGTFVSPDARTQRRRTPGYGLT